jgi:CBS domain-containing protein
MVVLQAAMLQLQAADAITGEFQVVEVNQTLEQFAATYLADASGAYHTQYYAESEGRYVGLIAVEALRSIERSQWSYQGLDCLIQPFEKTPAMPESTSLAEAIHQLETQQVPRLPVLSTTGAVVGVLDRVTIVQALGRKLNLQVPEAVLQQINAEGQFPPNLQLQSVAKDALR